MKWIVESELQTFSDMARATLLEVERRVGEKGAPAGKPLKPVSSHTELGAMTREAPRDDTRRRDVIKPRKDSLSRSNVKTIRNTGWPKGRETYGHGVLIVVGGVTPTRGGWENQPQGEAGQEVCWQET